MFENFTFGAMPQPRQQEDFDFPSPTDTSHLPQHAPQTTYSFSPNQYDSQHSEQMFLQKSRDELVKQFDAWRMDQGDLEVDDSETSDEPMSLPPTPILSHTSIGTSATCRRLQRQLNVQLMSCSSHMKDISSLVEDMITSNSQCTLRAPSPPSSRDGMDKLVVDTRNEFEMQEDEGYCDDEEPEMSLRRAAVPVGIRKNCVRYGRSADVINVDGRLKVKSVPRMRRRKHAVKRE